MCRYYGDILHGLHRLFADSEPDDAVRDNAAGAIARMIIVQPQSIPLNQVGTLQYIIFCIISDFKLQSAGLIRILCLILRYFRCLSKLCR